MIYTKSYQPEPNKKSPSIYFISYNHSLIIFANKNLDFIPINKILRNKDVNSELPNILQNDETPTVAYNLRSAARN